MQLIKAPNNFLEKKVKSFDFETMDPVKISMDMLEIMKKYKGIGLSANQVELDAQIFIMGEENSLTIINPTILEVSTNKIEMDEGCLSFPGLFLKIKRPDIITVKYLDTQQKECIIKLEGFHARVFLHEYDHLQGITFDQRVSKMRLEMSKKKQEKLIKSLKNG
jgi:peptide deformylase